MTHLFVILDRSGSMSSIWNDTIGGLNTYLSDLRKDKTKYKLTLTAFDNEIVRPVEGIDLAKVAEKDYDSIRPRGGTTLYNTINKTISDLEEQVKPKDKALVLILTDGGENSSVEWKKDAIAKMITKLEKTNWTFTYLGANQDSWANAQGLGFQMGNVANFHATAGGVTNAFATMSSNTSAYARSAVMNSKSFYAGDKDNLDKVK